MKIRNGLALACLAFLSVTLASCGQSDPDLPTPYTPGSPLTAERVKEFKSDAGSCLDIEKVQAAAAKSKRSRMRVYDLHILDDGTPVSFQFEHSIVENTVIRQSPIRVDSYPRWQQIGCESLELVDHNGAKLVTAKITQATETKIVSAEASYQNPSEPEQHTQVSFELVADNRLRETTETGYTAPHDKTSCGIGQEDHEVHSEAYWDFDKILVSAPTASTSLKQLQEEDASYQSPTAASLRKTREAAYCAHFQH